jgi:Sigma-70 region 2
MRRTRVVTSVSNASPRRPLRSRQFGQAIVTARNDDHDEERIEAGRQAAAKPTDAAIRRVLIEGQRDLLAFLHRRLGSREEAEEVLQRFAVRALERASDLRNVHSVRGWLSRILATTIADHQRRAIRQRRREVLMEQQDLELTSHAITPDSEIDGVICDCLYRPEVTERGSGTHRGTEQERI